LRRQLVDLAASLIGAVLFPVSDRRWGGKRSNELYLSRLKSGHGIFALTERQVGMDFRHGEPHPFDRRLEPARVVRGPDEQQHRTAVLAEQHFQKAELVVFFDDVQLLGDVLGGGAGQVNLYYCIPKVPPYLQTQVFSTKNGGSWTIKY
jgi:hypothetical protein